MEKERMSRREFLLLGFDVTAATGISLFFGPRLYPFAGLLNKPEEGSIEPGDFEKVIITKEQDLFFGGEGHKKVRLNTRVFAQALADVANLMIPEGGAEALYAVLEKKPLTVAISPSDLDPHIINGQRVETSGEYIRYLRGGPKIVFFPKLINEYYGAQRTSYKDLQQALDEIVWHEIVHLVQDLKSPLGNPMPDLIYNIGETAYLLGFGKEPDRRDFPHEVEGKRIGEEIAEAKLGEYSKLLSSQQSWPFGKFFVFG